MIPYERKTNALIVFTQMFSGEMSVQWLDVCLCPYGIASDYVKNRYMERLFIMHNADVSMDLSLVN